MPAKRERGFNHNCKTFSTKRSRCKNEQVKISGLQSHCTGNEPVKSTPAVLGNCFSSPCETEAEIEKTKYEQRKEADSLEWSAIREELIKTFTSLELPVRFVCSLCATEVKEPIRCLDCHSMFTCCADCEVVHHRYLLHKPEIWNVSLNNYSLAVLYCCMCFN